MAQFDLLARIYPTLERLVFGARLERARRAFLEFVAQAECVLLVGEGNGRFLESLMAAKTAGQVRVVEKSPKMVRLAKQRAVNSRQVALEFLEADFRQCQFAEQFDCVVTHFFLDLFNPPSQLAIIKKIAEVVAEGGTWINVDFVPASTLRGDILMRLQYAFFRVMSRIEAKRCFDESGLATGAGWIISETLSYLGGLVLARRYRRNVGADE
jgi:tRNA (cmo5U34)-methyltransferase